MFKILVALAQTHLKLAHVVTDTQVRLIAELLMVLAQVLKQMLLVLLVLEE
jgi:hypothetical protein